MERCKSWGVTPLRLLGGGTQALVVAGDRAGVQVVVKYVHDKSWFTAELAALQAWPPGVAPRVLDSTPDTALLSWISGTVPTRKDLALIETLARRIVDAAVKAPAGTRTLKDRVSQTQAWFAARAPWTNPNRVTEFNEGLQTLYKLVSQTSGDYLLHTDFKAQNLVEENGVVHWVDPMACAGPLEFDVAYTCWSLRFLRGWQAPFPFSKQLPLPPKDPRKVAEKISQNVGLSPTEAVKWAEALSFIWETKTQPS